MYLFVYVCFADMGIDWNVDCTDLPEDHREPDDAQGSAPQRVADKLIAQHINKNHIDVHVTAEQRVPNDDDREISAEERQQKSHEGHCDTEEQTLLPAHEI